MESLSQELTPIVGTLASQIIGSGTIQTRHLSSYYSPHHSNRTSLTQLHVFILYSFHCKRYNRGHWKWLDIKNGKLKVYEWGEKNLFKGKEEQHYTTDFIFDRGIDFMGDAVEKDEAFALVLSVPDPHSPNQVRAPFDTMFDSTEFDVPNSAIAAYMRNPARPVYANNEEGSDPFDMSIKEAQEYIESLRTDSSRQEQLRKYFGMVAAIDLNVGKVLSAIDDLGITDNTIVVFTADHGGK